MSRARRWCFTLNNPTDDEVQAICDYGQLPSVEYLVFGREVAPSTGTPHLQGYVCFRSQLRLSAVKREFNGRAHYQVSRGSPEENRAYCTKEDREHFIEYGVLPQAQGHRSELTSAREWILEYVNDNKHIPTDRELATAHPGPFLRYRLALMHYARTMCPAPTLQEGEPNEWQSELEQELDDAADDRKIIFYVDPSGGSGKSWFTRYFLTRFPEKTQILGVGRRDDMAFAVDESKSVFFLSVPRGQMEFLQYSILEALKDRMVFSNKYESQMKVLHTQPHVVVFSNEEPDEDKLSADRFDIRRI